jgi:Cu/Ag efflux protein CusF
MPFGTIPVNIGRSGACNNCGEAFLKPSQRVAMFKGLIAVVAALSIMSMGLLVSNPAEAGGSQSAASKYGTPEHTARMLASRGILQPNSPQTAWVSAEVRGTDVSAQRVYVSHVAVKSIRMPAMTMTFAVTDPALLAKLKRGDRIDIEVANIAGAATVVNFRPHGT